MFLEKTEDAYPTSAPDPCSRFVVETELLIYFCFFVRIVLVILYSLLCVSVFPVWYLSLDCILLISNGIFVPFITLCKGLIKNSSHLGELIHLKTS